MREKNSQRKREPTVERSYVIKPNNNSGKKRNKTKGHHSESLRGRQISQSRARPRDRPGSLRADAPSICGRCCVATRPAEQIRGGRPASPSAALPPSGSLSGRNERWEISWKWFPHANEVLREDRGACTRRGPRDGAATPGDTALFCYLSEPPGPDYLSRPPVRPTPESMSVGALPRKGDLYFSIMSCFHP